MKNQRDTNQPLPQQPTIRPDTGKKGVQPIGTVKPYPPRPVQPIAKTSS